MGSGELACSVCGVTSTSLRKRKPSSRLVAVPAEAIVLVASPSERAGAAQSAAAGCQLSGLCQVHYAANVRAQAEALKAREAAANKRKTRAQGAAQDQGAAEPEWLQQALVRLLAEQAAKQSAAPALGGGASTADELLAPPVRTTRAAARVLAVARGGGHVPAAAAVLCAGFNAARMRLLRLGCNLVDNVYQATTSPTTGQPRLDHEDYMHKLKCFVSQLRAQQPSDSSSWPLLLSLRNILAVSAGCPELAHITAALAKSADAQSVPLVEALLTTP
ncbi:hypothetical protein TSOC_013111, partial [Tetrabaena socialis]